MITPTAMMLLWYFRAFTYKCNRPTAKTREWWRGSLLWGVGRRVAEKEKQEGEFFHFQFLFTYCYLPLVGIAILVTSWCSQRAREPESFPLNKACVNIWRMHKELSPYSTNSQLDIHCWWVDIVDRLVIYNNFEKWKELCEFVILPTVSRCAVGT